MSKTKLDRHIWGHWLTIENYQNYNSLSNALTGFTGDNILGYVYIDHTAGTTLEVVKLFNRNDGKIEFVDDPYKKETRVIIRQAQFTDTDYNIIDDKFFGDYELIKPFYLKVYDKENLTDFRMNEIFDLYRADDFPDDIQLLLVPDNDKMKPELVWGRVEDYSNTDNQGNCCLLVQPHQKIGVNINDSLTFSLIEIDNKIWPLGIIDNESKPKSQIKPWWKKW